MAKKARYVLDSFALLAYLQAEASGSQVRALLESAQDAQAELYISFVNVGEMYYILHREQGVERAEEMLSDLRTLPVELVSATDDRIIAAARIKATHSLSYADAFAVALAQEQGATLVTGDPEFHAVETDVNILWLTNP